MLLPRRNQIPLRKLLPTFLVLLFGSISLHLVFHPLFTYVSSIDNYDNFISGSSPYEIKRYKDYCIIKNVIARKDLNDYEHVTLIIHLSSDCLDHRLVEQVQSWDGPVSLAVVLPETNTAEAMLSTQHLLLQYGPQISSKVSAHFVYKSDKKCTYPIGKKILKNVSDPYIYPMSNSKYILITDYELIFSKNFEQQMLLLANSELTANPKMALVFRIFEVEKRVGKIPRDRKELSTMIQRGQAIQFHERYAGKAHTISGLKRWLSIKIPENKPSIDRIIPYRRRNWEPQFVSLHNIPFHDETFPYPLRDNTVLRWEMCRKNYTFALVNDLFTVHPGIKTPNKEIMKLKKLAWKQFWKALAVFKKRMLLTYPETVDKCPVPGY